MEEDNQTCASHRQPAADVSDEEEGIVLEVSHHGVAAAQLCGPTIPLMVVADAAIPHHGQNEWEDPLQATGVKARKSFCALCNAATAVSLIYKH